MTLDTQKKGVERDIYESGSEMLGERAEGGQRNRKVMHGVLQTNSNKIGVIALEVLKILTRF